MRTLLIVTDTERARPRRSVTGSVARFDRFLLFSASPECKRKVILGNSRKLRKSIKGRQAKGCAEVGISALTRQQSRTVLFKMRSGREGAVNREANLPARSPPPAKPLCVAQNTAFLAPTGKLWRQHSPNLRRYWMKSPFDGFTSGKLGRSRSNECFYGIIVRGTNTGSFSYDSNNYGTG